VTPDEKVRIELDDLTVEELRAAADDRDIDLDELLARLLVAASGHVDELLGPAEQRKDS
jgi:hypothetical protein